MKRLLAYLIVVLGLGLTFNVSADSNKPIIIPTHNWSGQIVMAYVIGGIFKKWETMLNMLTLIVRLSMSL